MPTKIYLTGRVLEPLPRFATEKSTFLACEFLSYLEIQLPTERQEEISRLFGFDVTASVIWAPEDFPFEECPEFWRPPAEVRDMLNRTASLIEERTPETEALIVGMIEWLGWIPTQVPEPERTDGVRRIVVRSLRALADTAQRFHDAGESLVYFQVYC